MTFGDLAAFVSGAAALATALLAYLTVRELARQRSSSYQPDLTANTQLFEGRSSGGWLMSFHAPASFGSGSATAESTGDDRLYKIGLFNVGRGVAKDISLEWQIDYETIITDINQMLQDRIILANITPNKLCGLLGRRISVHR